jgi:uncharacterized protein (TIGR01777 family)
MNILITGGSGFIGTKLTESFTADGHQVSILSRKARQSDNRLVNYLQWDGKKFPLATGIFDVIINLAGASIAGSRWTESYKKTILQSRLDTTKACVDFINKSNRPPKVFVSASAIGYYGGMTESVKTEADGPGDDFLAEVCKQWEAASQTTKCRVVNPRIGVVLGVEDGAYPKMVTPYKFWLGGRFGSGKQGFSWIHIDDIVGSIRFAIDHDQVEGPVNLVDPDWVDQATFSEKLAHSLGVMDLMVVPEFALKMIFGEQAVLFWGGQKVLPKKLEEIGYNFKYSDLEGALAHLNALRKQKT